MKRKIILMSLCLSFNSSFAAQGLSQGTTSSAPPNLIEESNTLKIQAEDSVQSDSKGSERIYGLRVGQLTGSGDLIVTREGEEFVYDLNRDITEIGARFGIYPFQGWLDLGLETGVSYFSVTNKDLLSDLSNSAKLHVIGLEGLVSVKHRLSFAPFVIPQLAVGGGVKGLFQRGYSNENTSLSREFALAILAINFDLSRFKPQGGLDWGFFVDAREYFDGSFSSDVNGLRAYSLGVNISL